MAGKGTKKPSASRDSAGRAAAPPPRLRLKLTTAEDCRRELAKLYREARGRRLDVADASRLANILQILSRLIETSDLEARVERLEANRLLEESGRRPRTH